MRWQKRARLGIAIFGIAFAGVVFFAIGERQPPTAAPAPARADPKAIFETARGLMNRLTGNRQDYAVTFDSQTTYESGDSKLLSVRIDVKGKQGRDFTITGAEALANEKTRQIKLSGNVKLVASDGFELTTGTASFRENDGIVRTPGAVSFRKNTMSGTGVGMVYDKNSDVLTIDDQAHVVMVDEAGKTSGEFTAGAATLARQDNYLALSRTVHALRAEQIIDADQATARLTDNEEAITAIELRGNARVAGGSAAFDSMSARDIDLDYADDGHTIEQVVLNGSGAIALKGRSGAPGRQMLGESLTLMLAPDGAVTSAIGRNTVQLNLPASQGSAARQVRAAMLDAAGEPGKGMTSAQFSGEVEYREEALQEAPPRTARSRTLQIGLDGDAISSAVFSGRVQFEEKGLRASSADAHYEPAAGVLRLKGADDGGGPRVADEQITIEADAIDVTLDGRRILAKGTVKTRLQGGARTPGLLKKEQPANVSAAGLTYDGEIGRASYRGGAQLWQGDTAIRGDTIVIDQQKGNLSATGGARTTLMLGGATSIGRAEETRYEDTTRQITYVGLTPPAAAASETPIAPRTPRAPPAPGAPAARVAGPAPGAPLAPGAVPAQLSGPQGDLRADRIVVVLAKDESRIERLEAYDSVTLRLDQRTATGARLTYHSADERYVMSGTTTVPVAVTEACRQTTGRTLTFFRSTDRIVVDGNEEIRTRTTSGGTCAQPPPQ